MIATFVCAPLSEVITMETLTDWVGFALLTARLLTNPWVLSNGRKMLLPDCVPTTVASASGFAGVASR